MAEGPATSKATSYCFAAIATSVLKVVRAPTLLARAPDGTADGSASGARPPSRSNPHAMLTTVACCHGWSGCPGRPTRTKESNATAPGNDQPGHDRQRWLGEATGPPAEPALRLPLTGQPIDSSLLDGVGQRMSAASSEAPLRQCPRAECEARYPKACECLRKDEDTLSTFYNVPAAHRIHPRTPSPIELAFANIRHQAVRPRGAAPASPP